MCKTIASFHLDRRIGNVEDLDFDLILWPAVVRSITPTPLATIKPFFSGVLLRANIPRKWPSGTAMMSPVPTSRIDRAGIS